MKIILFLVLFIILYGTQMAVADHFGLLNPFMMRIVMPTVSIIFIWITNFIWGFSLDTFIGFLGNQPSDKEL